jgi:hypothetical protein
MIKYLVKLFLTARVIFILAANFVFSSQNSMIPGKYALLIGINKYDENTKDISL